MTVYHGQHVRPAAGRYAWRVDDERTVWTERNGFYCVQNDIDLWFVGAPLVVPSNDRVIAALQTFGQRLWREGYVSGGGLRLILEGGGSLDTEINAENPGTLTTRYDTSSELGGLIPYSVNWLLEDNRYNFAPNPPPDD